MCHELSCLCALVYALFWDAPSCCVHSRGPESPPWAGVAGAVSRLLYPAPSSSLLIDPQYYLGE